jgi:cytochrome c5
MTMRKFALIIAVLAAPCVAAGALAQQAAAPGVGAAPPPGPGLDLINERCGFCHTVGQVFAKRRTEADWAATVQGMADRGAEVSPEEIKTITGYLAQNYAAGPSGAAPTGK